MECVKQNNEIVEKRKFFVWLKAHKKQLLLAGIAVSVVIASVLMFKNKDSVITFWEDLKSTIEKEKTKIPTSETVQSFKATEIQNIVELSDCEKSSSLIDVRTHIMNLPENKYPSPEKVAFAFENGIELGPHQTIRNGYTKGLNVA